MGVAIGTRMRAWPSRGQLRFWLLSVFLVACKPSDGPGDSEPPHTGETDAPDREWVEISTAPCGRDSEGYVECWSSEAWRQVSAGAWFIEPGAVRVREISNLHGPLWGVRVDNDLPYYFVGPPDGAPPVTGFTHLNTQCAINAGQVVCWQTSPSHFPPNETYVSVHGELFSHAALTTDNQLLVRFQSDADAGYDFTLDPARVIVKTVHVEPSDACVLDSEGVVECFGPSGYHFDNPPYVNLAAGRFAACAVREDWLIECRDGSTFDFGPIRDIEVTLFPSYSLIEEGTPNERWFPNYPDSSTPPHICVITEDNAVRCEGWKYEFSDLQASLPAGDG